MRSGGRLALAAAAARPSTRSVVLLTGLLGAWASLGQSSAGRVAGLLAGALAAAADVELALVGVALAGASAGAAWRTDGLDVIWHTSGIDLDRRRAVTAATGAATGLLVLAAFAVGGALAGLGRALAAGSGWWATPGLAVGSTGSLASLATRTALAAGLLGALAALVGRHLSSTGAAVGVALAASLPFVTVGGAVLGRGDAALTVLALTPVGALRGVTLGRAGLQVPGLEADAHLPVSVAVFALWLLAAALVEPLTVARRSRLVLAPHRDARRDVRGPRAAVRPAVAAAVVVATTALVVALPPAVNPHLPWRWQPAWRDARRAGVASDQVVAATVQAVRDPRADGTPARHADLAALPEPLRDVVRRGSDVEVSDASTMRSPEEVWVRVELDPPLTSGAVELRAVTLRVTLEHRDDGGWHITGGDGPFALDGAALRSPAVAP